MFAALAQEPAPVADSDRCSGATSARFCERLYGNQQVTKTTPTHPGVQIDR
jgi:hypothetical protein